MVKHERERVQRNLEYSGGEGRRRGEEEREEEEREERRERGRGREGREERKECW